MSSVMKARLWGSVKCGVCGNKLKLLAGPETFTCKRSKKTLPRRLAHTR